MNLTPNSVELGSVQPQAPISDSHDKCYTSFQRLISSLDHPVRDFSDQLPRWEVVDEFDRYKIWAGNVGAKHRGKRYQISLDFRLSEAPFYHQKVFVSIQTSSTTPADQKSQVFHFLESLTAKVLICRLPELCSLPCIQSTNWTIDYQGYYYYVTMIAIAV